MTPLASIALAIIGTAAGLYLVRRFALWIAGLSEGVRPQPTSDYAYGDSPALPNDLKLSSGGVHSSETAR